MIIIKYEFWNADMETMKLRSHIGADGILQIQTPTDLKVKHLTTQLPKHLNTQKISYLNN